MTATCIHLDADRATVVLRPCWIARMFGAKTLSVELVSDGHYLCDGEKKWRYAGTNVALFGSKHSGLIRRALDFRPMPTVPVAIARVP